jgi:nucleotide-binding universal stress UspA family protein
MDLLTPHNTFGREVFRSAREVIREFLSGVHLNDAAFTAAALEIITARLNSSAGTPVAIIAVSDGLEHPIPVRKTTIEEEPPTMKLLFCYNGTKAADAAIADLAYCGLPADVEIAVLTVAEVWKPDEMLRAEAERSAGRAIEKIHRTLASVSTFSRVSFGSPAAEILAAAEAIGPDLIVLAEREQSLGERNIFLGTATQKVMMQARCSVRIARGSSRDDRHAGTIIIGFDGSSGSQAAVDGVIERTWPAETNVSLAVVADNDVVSSLGRFTPQMANPNLGSKIAVQWGEAIAEGALRRLKQAGLSTGLSISTGNAKDALVEQAKAHRADAIFVGPHCMGNSFERYLIGSVSSAVAARAECSVEIVRKREWR